MKTTVSLQGPIREMRYDSKGTANTYPLVKGKIGDYGFEITSMYGMYVNVQILLPKGYPVHKLVSEDVFDPPSTWTTREVMERGATPLFGTRGRACISFNYGFTINGYLSVPDEFTPPQAHVIDMINDVIEGVRGLEDFRRRYGA